MYLMQCGPQVRLPAEEPSQVGECRRAAQRLAEAWEFDETLVGRAGIIATELANNLVKHAKRGELLLQALHGTGRVMLEIVSVDRGPGMQVERCMRDGYSTGGTAGTGLGAISRLSQLFDVYSAESQGTVAVSRIERQLDAAVLSATFGLEFGAINLALSGEIECGDAWRIAANDGVLAVMVADGLGHGPLAARAAQAAAQAFSENPFDQPSAALQRFHTSLSGGRGAAAACAILDADQRKVRYAGVGNIAGTLTSPSRTRGMVSHNGILGVELQRKQQFEYDYAPDDRIVMHSDGMSQRWSLADYPGLSFRHAAVIAGVLYRDHARLRDDVTVVVSGLRS
jgi:anti-sigma regulatory factor (Ser/Thr protein kinase)